MSHANTVLIMLLLFLLALMPFACGTTALLALVQLTCNLLVAEMWRKSEWVEDFEIGLCLCGHAFRILRVSKNSAKRASSLVSLRAIQAR